MAKCPHLSHPAPLRRTGPFLPPLRRGRRFTALTDCVLAHEMGEEGDPLQSNGGGEGSVMEVPSSIPSCSRLGEAEASLRRSQVALLREAWERAIISKRLCFLPASRFSRFFGYLLLGFGFSACWFLCRWFLRRLGFWHRSDGLPLLHHKACKFCEELFGQ